MSKLIDRYNLDEPINDDNYENEILINLKFNLESIENITFTKCKFTNVTFNDLYMGSVTFDSCEFTNCYFLNTTLNKVDFKDSKLTDVVFDKGKAFHLKMLDSVIQYCHISFAEINDGMFNSRFISCYFDVNLTGCDFRASEFIDWQINKMLCEKVYFDKCKIQNIIGDIKHFKGATLSMTQAFDLLVGMGIDIKEFIE